ncbi:MAG: PadR family transcriptional regulator [Bacillota bacterium]|nr:PadR family transcriptional regulator [Bacillota bacterium]
MTHHEEILENLIQELRRGSLVLFVLSQMDQKQYGYSLLQNLTDKGMSIEPGTLYPLMRRLEKQGLLDSQWDTEDVRPRKYYILSADGVMVLEKMKAEWKQLVQQMNSVLYVETNE